MDCDCGNAEQDFFIISEQFADKPHDTVEDHHVGIDRTIRNVLFVLQNGQEINENEQGQNGFHDLRGEMIAMGSDIINTMLPRITFTATREYAGELCEAASDQGIHDNGIASETAFNPQDQGRNDGKQWEEDKQTDDTVYCSGNTEELNFSQIFHTGPDSVAEQSRTVINHRQNDDHFPKGNAQLLSVPQTVQKSDIGCSGVDPTVHGIMQALFCNFLNQFIHKYLSN